jgi:hypothetical protein
MEVSMGCDFFGNAFWPSECVYNIQGEAGSKCEGGADIEHHFVMEGVSNVWKQRRKDKVDQAVIAYACEASIRCSCSD